MTLTMLVIAVAVMTYASRASALVVLPAPHGWLAEVVVRLPAPLFAGLAAATLFDVDGALPSLPALAAAAGALAVAPRRSLGLTLIAGIAAFGGGTLVVAALA